MMFCPNCGANAGSAKFCPECGTRIPTQDSASSMGTGTLTIRKYSAERMKDIVADVYIDGTFQTVVGNSGSLTLTLPAGTRELLIHADGCVDAIQKINIEPLENRLCVFSVDDVGFINIVQQGNPSRSAAFANFKETPKQPTYGSGGSAVAYQEPVMTERFSRDLQTEQFEEDLEENTWTESTAETYAKPENTKYCKFCGSLIHEESVVCPNCGRQVEELRTEGHKVVVQNITHGKPKDKWVAFFLCLLFGIFGAHKFYEGKIGLGILYLFTAGLFGIGYVIDLISILLKPNPYYV